MPDAGFDLDAVKIIPDPYTAAPDIISQPAVHVYPNPSVGKFSIAVTGKSESCLTVFDPAGRVILRTPPQNGIILINLTGYSDGIYYASLVIDGFPVTVKLIKLN